MTAHPLSCREAIEFLAAYLDGELAVEEHQAFGVHLSRCPACVDYLATYRKTIQLGKRALAADVEGLDDVPAELVNAVLAARRRS